MSDGSRTVGRAGVGGAVGTTRPVGAAYLEVTTDPEHHGGTAALAHSGDTVVPPHYGGTADLGNTMSPTHRGWAAARAHPEDMTVPAHLRGTAAPAADATLLLAVHGTRQDRGRAVARELAAAVADRGGVPVRLGFADVAEPSVARVAAEISGPIVVVPAFLAAGYHVRVDIPAQLAEAGRADAAVTPPIGSDPRVAATLARRLTQAGWRRGDAVVLAAAGSSDAGALAEVDAAAARLAERIGTRVRVGYVTTARPTVAEAVAQARAAGASRVVVATWLLAPGLFHDWLADAGADALAAPLCPDPGVADAVLARFRAAAPSARAAGVPRRPVAAGKSVAASTTTG